MTATSKHGAPQTTLTSRLPSCMTIVPYLHNKGHAALTLSRTSHSHNTALACCRSSMTQSLPLRIRLLPMGTVPLVKAAAALPSRPRAKQETQSTPGAACLFSLMEHTHQRAWSHALTGSHKHLLPTCTQPQVCVVHTRYFRGCC